MASSQHDNHAGNLVFDGDPTTSWVTDTDGVGQSLSVRFKSPATITSISVLNGNARDLEHYQANNRVRTLRIKWGDGSSQIITLEDKMKMQRFPLQHRVATDSLKFEILSTYLGARNNWAAISEIAFNREASDFPETPQDRQSQPRQPIAPAVASTFPSPSIAPLPSAPVIREVVASSELTLDGQTRQGNFAFDGNPSTVWVTKGDGVGQSISVYFKSPATISSVSILNSAATEEARYRTMSHAQTIRMELSDGSVQTLTFEDKMGWQHFDLPQPKVADWVKFEIVTIFHGTKFKTVPIAEIVFNRDVLDNVPASPEQKQSSAPHPRRSPKPAPGY